MLFQKQVKVYLSISIVLVMLVLVVCCINMSSAELMGLGTSINLFELGKSAEGKAYITVASSAKRAYMNHLSDPSNTEPLEKLVAISNDFLSKYPSSEWIAEISFYHGKALLHLGHLETGIATLEKLITDTPPDHAVVTRYTDYSKDAIRWYPFERALLEIGLAYDKLKQHDTADAIYKKLITQPEFIGGMQAEIARQMLGLDKALRIENVPILHNVWIGKTTPNFRLENKQWKEPSLHQHRGQVILLYYGATNRQVLLNLMKIHNKYENQEFQIITANADLSDTSQSKSILKNGSAWLHYRDRYGKIVDIFQIRSIPAIFLFDSEGTVRKTKLNETTLENAVDELVAENNATYDDPRTQEVITAALESHGGLEKLQRVESFVYNYHTVGYLKDGSIDNEGNGIYYSYRDKYRSENLTDIDKQFIKIFDGKAVYEKTGNKPYKRLPPEHAEYVMGHYKDIAFNEPIWLITTLANDELPIQYVGTENVEGTLTSVLRVRQPSGTPIKIFISQKTGYIIQYVIEHGPVNRVISLGQYKDIDGIKFPHHWVEKYYYHTETSYRDVRFNVEIDPKLFNPKK